MLTYNAMYWQTVDINSLYKKWITSLYYVYNIYIISVIFGVKLGCQNVQKRTACSCYLTLICKVSITKKEQKSVKNLP